MDRFAGQWIGRFEGTNRGIAILDLDIEEDFLSGAVTVIDDELNNPGVFSQFRVKPKGKRLELSLSPIPFDPQTANFVRFSSLTEPFATTLDVNLDLGKRELAGTWKTDLETSGTVRFGSSSAELPSEYTPEETQISWEAFQEKVAELADAPPYRFVFRGQPKPWRLRTSFHRTDRKDLWRYWDQDVQRVKHASVGVIDQLFETGNPDHNGAFMHLLQHHGYPTPMLDWTYSPYIAAFFAYSSLGYKETSSEPIRIFMFDAEQWKADFNQVLNITLCGPHFSLIEPLALANTRALPQQSIASITNVDDIETYISRTEDNNGKSYLRVFDLDPKDRKKALRQLGLMGISPGSMFPGIEGLCREYRDRHFGYKF